MSQQKAHDIADAICLQVAELPDRNSPEDWPDAMLVTHDELHRIVIDAFGVRPGEGTSQS